MLYHLPVLICVGQLRNRYSSRSCGCWQIVAVLVELTLILLFHSQCHEVEGVAEEGFGP
jgi:hypothetical protein